MTGRIWSGRGERRSGGLAALVAVGAICVSATAVADLKPEHCAASRENVKEVMGELEVVALIKGARGSPAYNAVRREGYRELSRSFAAHRARVAAQRAAPSDSGSAATIEPKICFDVARMPGQVEPGDASPSSRRALDSLLATLAEDLVAELPDLSGKRGRIWFGHTPQSCENLDAVAILNTRKQLICSGLLVDRRHVLSAAHCVCQLGSLGGSVVLGETIDPSKTGDLRRRAEAEIDPLGTRTPVEDPCLSSERRRGADIALFTLQSDLAADATCTKEKKPLTARIAAMGAVLDPRLTKVRVSGFGRTDYGGIGDKLYAHVGVYSSICGPEPVSRKFGCVPGRETVLLDPAGMRDTCGGDSGGPVYLKSGGNFLAYAITSRGLPGGVCGSGGIYTLITPRVVGWMRSNGVNVDAND